MPPWLDAIPILIRVLLAQAIDRLEIDSRAINIRAILIGIVLNIIAGARASTDLRGAFTQLTMPQNAPSSAMGHSS
jgi:ABC-type arginine transport system permease subunit